MNRFILIDNSIVDTTGHHFQYALSCLQAAESQNFEPILVTNIKYDNSNKIPYKTLPVYRLGFWGGDDKSASISIARIVANLLKSNKQKKTRRSINRKYSVMGFLWEALPNLPTYFTNKVIEKDKILKSKYMLLALIIIFGIPIRFYLSLNKRKEKKINSLKPYFDFFKILIISRPIDPINGAKNLESRIKFFAKDTKNLIAKIGIKDGDQFFIPTTGITEMFGVLEFLKNNAESSKITWHFLYRRNIFHGSRCDYGNQLENVRAIRNAFQELLAEIPNDKIFLYTDTEELTNQYNLLGLKKFKTLPIPHTHDESHHKIDQNKIVISYLGDARDEKGYHILPHVIQDLWFDYVKTDKVVFKIQSNFNVPRGEPKSVVARSQLDNFPSDKVTIISKSLSSDDYSNLLLNSNLILLPYDGMNYFARSSGILVEALAAGIPVLVPAGCWMARQFSKKTYEYHISVRDSLKLITSFSSRKLRWYAFGATKFDRQSEYLVFSDYSNRLITKVKVFPNTSHLMLSFDFTEDPTESIVGGHVRFLNPKSIEFKNTKFIIEKSDSIKKGTRLYEIPEGTNYLLIELFNPYGINTIRISNFQMDLMENTSQVKIPTNVIGQVFSDPAEISEKLIDIIDNYQHYLNSAKAFAVEYFAYHNSKKLIAILSNTSINDIAFVKQK